MRTHYDNLKVSRDAPIEVIHAAFRTLAAESTGVISLDAVSGHLPVDAAVAGKWRYHIPVKAAALFLALCLPALADFAAGLQAIKNGDYATPIKEFLPLAEQGNAFAQFNLAAMYIEGRGVLRDYAEAVRWDRKAAEQGHAGAQFNIGLAYDRGEGMPRDYAEAARWFRKAAEQGDAGAQFNLGVTYDRGKGVPQDYAEALRWYLKAAGQGHARAQFNVGVMYENGKERPKILYKRTCG